MKQDLSKTLVQFPPIKISPSTVEWFLSHCQIHTYPVKTTIVNKGDPADTLYYVVRGSTVVYLKDPEEKEVILSSINEGEFIGEISLFEEVLQERTAWVRTKSASKIATISYRKFKQLIYLNPEILLYLSAQMARRLRQTSLQVGNLAFLDVAGRVANTLLHFAQQPDAITHPQGMQIKITRQELGQIVGCSRETVGRVLKILEHDGMITAHGKTVVVLGDRA